MKSYCKKYLLFLILLLTFSISGCGEEEQLKVTDTRFSMDTFVKIDAYSDKPGEARLAIDDAMQTFQKQPRSRTVLTTAAPVPYTKPTAKLQRPRLRWLHSLPDCWTIWTINRMRSSILPSLLSLTSGSWPAARTDCPLRKNYRNPYAIQVKTNIILTLPHKH